MPGYFSQLVAFLQETTFYVVEEGRVSNGWHSPLQRKLAPELNGVHTGWISLPSTDGDEAGVTGGLRGVAAGSETHHDGPHAFWSNVADGHHDTLSESTQPLEEREKAKILGSARVASLMNAESEGFPDPHGSTLGIRGSEGALPRERLLTSKGVAESGASCPLIYTVDAKLAKKYGLLLFQVCRQQSPRVPCAK